MKIAANTEIADAIRSHGHALTEDVRQLWHRLVLNLLITSVDDHLQNHGFLYVERGLWRLAPAFDLNPFPDKDRESKTWLSERDAPITDVHMLVARAQYFALDQTQALAVMDEVHAAMADWRRVACGAEVGLRPAELDDFASAFEHEQMAASAALMSLIQSARLNGHDLYAYLKDVLTRLPTQKNSALAELLPHHWTSEVKA